MRIKGSEVSLTINGEKFGEVKDFNYDHAEVAPDMRYGKALPTSLTTIIDITMTEPRMPGLRFEVTYDSTGLRVPRVVENFFKNFSLKHYVGPIKSLHARFDVYNNLQCMLVMKVGNREPPHWPIEVQFTGGMNLYAIERLSPKEAEHACAKWLQNYLREATLHELDECIYIDNVRVFDPHPPPVSEPRSPKMMGVKYDSLITDEMETMSNIHLKKRFP